MNCNQDSVVREELTSVLEQLDGLADVWGDEAVFRRCRDRIRSLLESDDESPQQVLVATEVDSMEQALYIDGRLVMSDPTIYPHDIEAESGDSPMALKTVHINLDSNQVWPVDSVDLRVVEGS